MFKFGEKRKERLIICIRIRIFIYRKKSECIRNMEMPIANANTH